MELDSEDDKKAHDSDKGNNEQEPIQLKPCELSWSFLFSIRVGSVKMIKAMSEKTFKNRKKNLKEKLKKS